MAEESKPMICAECGHQAEVHQVGGPCNLKDRLGFQMCGCREFEDGAEKCAASIGPARCNLPNGHDGLHVRRGQIPETTVWWRCAPEDPVQKAITAERERCARVIEGWHISKGGYTELAHQIREGK